MLLRSLSDLKQRFSVGLCMRGERYFFEKRVRLERIDDDRVEAVVRGTHLYRVSLRPEKQGPGLAAICTCRGYSDTGVCKHIWATMLAVQEATPDPVPGEPRSSPIERSRREHPALPEPWRRPLGELRALAAEPELGPGQRCSLRLSFTLWAQGSVVSKSVSIEVLSQRKYKRGGWSEPRAFVRRNPDELEKLSDGDRRCLALLHGGHDNTWGYGRGSRIEVPPELQPILLPRVAVESRLLLRFYGEERETPLTADVEGRWDFGIVLTRRSPAGCTALEGILVRKDERLDLAETSVLLPGGLFIARERLGEVDWHGAWRVAQVLRWSGKFEVPSARESELFTILCGLPGEPLFEAPDIVRGVEGPPAPCLFLSEPESQADAGSKILGRIEFQYGPHRVRTDGGSLRVDGDGLVRISRDGPAERAALERLVASGSRLDASDEGHDVAILARDLPELVRALTAEGWHVEADGRLFRTSGSFSLSVRSGIDWFDLEGGAVFGEASAALPELLRAVRSGSRVVRLSDGSYGVLPEEWLGGWGLAGFAKVHEGSLRFQKSQAWLLDALIAERGAADVDAAFEKARAALRRIGGFRPAAEPAGFRGELRGYQREGLGWLHLLRELGLGGCLADDMGLGKTVQVLALLCDPQEGPQRPALVVAPRSVVFNWLREAERFAPGLSVLAHHGPERSRDPDEIARHALVVTTYGTLRRDVELLARIRFGHAILDEAQAIKNAESQSAKAARLLVADQRLVLTGTPVENHLDDLWSLFEFLNPGMLGRSRVFKNLLESKAGEAGEFRPLAQALRPFLLRRTKEQVLTELPPKVEQVIACDLEGKERQRYEELRDHYRATLLARADEQGLERVKMHVLAALLRLRQAACHPALLDRSRSAEGSAKLDALLPMLEEVRESGHKALVFSQFTSFLAVVRERLDAMHCPYEYLDGRTRKREDKVRRFQEDPACPLFLISLKAGGFGLNLTAADYVFLLDPWWNPAVERQAIDRAHRIGQTRPVNAYRLVARGTIEEKVLELQERKRDLADAILGEAEGTLRDLTREDLERLLS